MKKLIIVLMVMVSVFHFSYGQEKAELTIQEGETYMISSSDWAILNGHLEGLYLIMDHDFSTSRIIEAEGDFTLDVDVERRIYITVIRGTMTLSRDIDGGTVDFLKQPDNFIAFEVMEGSDRHTFLNETNKEMALLSVALDDNTDFQMGHYWLDVNQAPVNRYDNKFTASWRTANKGDFFDFKVASGKLLIVSLFEANRVEMAGLSGQEKGEVTWEWLTQLEEEASAWSKDSIIKMKLYGYFRDEAFGAYRDSITRQDFIYLAVRVFEVFEGEEITVDPSISFTDTDDIYALKGATIGITNGIGQGKFGPGLKISREQMAVLITNALRRGSVDKDFDYSFKFKDEREFSSWAHSSIYSVKSKGIMNGIDSHTFGPKGEASVEMALKMIDNILESYQGGTWYRGDKDYTLIDTRGVSGSKSSAEGIIKLGNQKSTLASNGLSYKSPTWAESSQSYLYLEGSDLVSVTVGDRVYIDTYDLNFNLKESKTLDFELPIFGTFYKGLDYNYLVYGQENPREDDQLEVIRIVKYDRAFNRLDSVSVSNCYTVLPFRASSVNLSEDNETLVLHTSRERYMTEDGKNHQSQLTLVIDKASHTIINNLGRYQDNHVSHSFDTLVLHDSGYHVLVDHGDAYPRSIVLHKGKTGSDYQSVDLFDIPGEVGANQTGVSLGGLSQSAGNYLLLMNSVNHEKVTEYTNFDMVGLEDTRRDILLLTIPKNQLVDTRVIQHKLTSYIGTDKYGSVPKLVKISDDRFLVLWQEFVMDEASSYGGVKAGDLKYVYVNGQGLVQGPIYSQEDLVLTDCQPILLGDKLIWTHQSYGTDYLYLLPIIRD